MAKTIKSLHIRGRDDFGKGCHIQSSKPYFYEATYVQPDDKPRPERINPSTMPKGEPFSCTRDCKPITNVEAAAILRLTTAFDLSIRLLHEVLQTCNDCPCVHYKRGHLLFVIEWQ